MKKQPKLVFEPRFRIRCGSRLLFGPGKAALLEHIQKTGSIVDAAKAMNMSYMRAWTLVKNMNGVQNEPFVETTRGGRLRGGAKLTKLGVIVLESYREIESQSLTATHLAQAKLANVLFA